MLDDRTAVELVLDITDRKATRTIPLAGCEHPTGLAYVHPGLLISACANGVAKVTRASDLKALADIAIGLRPDGAFADHTPSLRHVHLRDTDKGPGKFQVRVGQGEIEYGRIVALLERQKYDRLLTVAIEDIADAHFVMETEVRKLKFLLESLV